MFIEPMKLEHNSTTENFYHRLWDMFYWSYSQAPHQTSILEVNTC